MGVAKNQSRTEDSRGGGVVLPTFTVAEGLQPANRCDYYRIIRHWEQELHALYPPGRHPSAVIATVAFRRRPQSGAHRLFMGPSAKGSSGAGYLTDQWAGRQA